MEAHIFELDFFSVSQILFEVIIQFCDSCSLMSKNISCICRSSLSRRLMHLHFFDVLEANERETEASDWWLSVTRWKIGKKKNTKNFSGSGVSPLVSYWLSRLTDTMGVSYRSKLDGEVDRLRYVCLIYEESFTLYRLYNHLIVN